MPRDGGYDEADRSGGRAAAREREGGREAESEPERGPGEIVEARVRGRRVQHGQRVQQRGEQRKRGEAVAARKQRAVVPRRKIIEDPLLFGQASGPAYALPGEALLGAKELGARPCQVLPLVEPGGREGRREDVRVPLVLVHPLGRAQQRRQRLVEEIEHGGRPAKGPPNAQDIHEMGGEGEQARNEEEPETDTSQPGRLHVREGTFGAAHSEGSKERCPTIGDALLLSKFRRYIPIRREIRILSYESILSFFLSLFLYLSFSRSPVHENIFAQTGSHYLDHFYHSTNSFRPIFHYPSLPGFYYFFNRGCSNFAAIFLNHDQKRLD